VFEGEPSVPPRQLNEAHESLSYRDDVTRWLFAEDNPADAGLIRKALEEHGVEGEVTHIFDGETAIAFIEAIETDQLECPDLAIIDLNLQKRSGQDVLERMRQSPKCREVPVVILSSSDASRDIIFASRHGWRNFCISGSSSKPHWKVLPASDTRSINRRKMYGQTGHLAPAGTHPRRIPTQTLSEPRNPLAA
jgi:CheY-like chemotaxis protein